MSSNIQEMKKDLEQMNEWFQSKDFPEKKKEELQQVITLLQAKIQSKLLFDLYENEFQVSNLRQEVEDKIKKQLDFSASYEQRDQLLLYKEIRDALYYSSFEKKITDFYFLNKKIQKMKEKNLGKLLNRKSPFEIFGTTKVYYSLICKKNPKYVCYKNHSSLEPNYVMIDKVFSLFNQENIVTILDEYFSKDLQHYDDEEIQKNIQKIRLLEFLDKHHFYVEKMYSLENLLKDLTLKNSEDATDYKYQNCVKRNQELTSKNKLIRLFYRTQMKENKKELETLERKQKNRKKLQKEIEVFKKQYQQICDYLKSQNWFMISNNFSKEEIRNELYYIYQNQVESRRKYFVCKIMNVYNMRLEKQKFLEKYKQYPQIVNLLKTKEQEAYQIYSLFHDDENLFSAFLLKLFHAFENLSVEELKSVFGEEFIFENNQKVKKKYKERIMDYCETQKNKMKNAEFL